MGRAVLFWALTSIGLVGSNGTVHRLPEAFPPVGALAHHRVAAALETSTGAGRRVRWHVRVFESPHGSRSYDLGTTRPSAPPVFDAHDRVAYAVGDEIRWLDGRRERVPGLPRRATIVVLEFAPRGRAIALTVQWGGARAFEGAEAIFITSREGTREVASGFHAWAEVPDAIWSPNGRSIAYARQRSGQPWAVEAVRIVGGRPRRISGIGRAFAPVWSPDGRSIAFTASTSYNASSIYIRRLGGGERRLTTTALNRQAGAFSPNGKLLAVATGNALGVVPIRGGRVRILARVSGARSLRGPIYWPPP
jgi:hypothetical protein